MSSVEHGLVSVLFTAAFLMPKQCLACTKCAVDILQMLILQMRKPRPREAL